MWVEESWKGIYSFFKSWAFNLLCVALAGVGLSIRFSMLKGLGIKTFLVGLGAAFAVGIISFGTISLLSRFVTI